MGEKDIVIEVYYHYPPPGGQWVIYRNPTHRDVPVPGRMTFERARTVLKRRARFEKWQETALQALGLPREVVVDNSDRSYRLRNIKTGDIVTPDQLKFYFGDRPPQIACR